MEKADVARRRKDMNLKDTNSLKLINTMNRLKRHLLTL